MGVLDRWLGPTARRRRLAAVAPDGALRRYLRTPLPESKTDLRKLPVLALDLETTGGEPARDRILSFGWVGIDAQTIALATARHFLIRSDHPVNPESAVIHRITDDQAAGGQELNVVLGEFLEALSGRVLLAHHAQTEVGFIGAACRRVFGTGIAMPTVDTLQLAAGRNPNAAPGMLRLEALRRQYGLPRYPVHHALSDAIACGELFLALLAADDGPLPLDRHRIRDGIFG